MTNGTDDNRGKLGREQSGGSAAKQDQTRADSDRGYGAREGQRESGRDSDPDRGATSVGSSGAATRLSGADGGRTDGFGARGDQQHDDKAGWRAVGDADPDGRIGGEDEKPGDGDPLGAGVR